MHWTQMEPYWSYWYYSGNILYSICSATLSAQYPAFIWDPCLLTVVLGLGAIAYYPKLMCASGVKQLVHPTVLRISWYSKFWLHLKIQYTLLWPMMSLLWPMMSLLWKMVTLWQAVTCGIDCGLKWSFLPLLPLGDQLFAERTLD